MDEQNNNPIVNLINRLYEKEESISYGISELEIEIEKLENKLKIERSKVWLPIDENAIQIIEIQLNDFKKKKLEDEIFRSNLRIELLNSEWQRDKSLGRKQSQIEVEKYKKTKDAIFVITRLIIKEAALSGVIADTEIKKYNDLIVNNDNMILHTNPKNKKIRIEDIINKYLSKKKLRKKFYDGKVSVTDLSKNLEVYNDITTAANYRVTMEKMKSNKRAKDRAKKPM